MKSVITVFALCLISRILAQYSYCEPEDEFESDDTSTAEWEAFMDKLTDSTFQTYSLQCKSNTQNTASIDEHSDFLWDLRFTVYSERLNDTQKTIEDCYSAQNGTCDHVDFKTCMKSARKSMLDDIENSWTDKINEKLEELAKEC